MLTNNKVLTEIHEKDDYFLILEYPAGFDVDEYVIIAVCRSYNEAMAWITAEYEDIGNACIYILGGSWGRVDPSVS